MTDRHSDPLAEARGVAIGLAISVPLWALLVWGEIKVAAMVLRVMAL